MKRILASLVLVSSLLLTGCGFWMNGERLYITPHQGSLQQTSGEITEVETYQQMRDALVQKIEAGSRDLVVSVSSFDEATADFYVNTAITHILQKTPIGAYAVNDITYEIGTNRGEQVIAFHVDYRHGIGEIMQIKSAENEEEAITHITNALKECDDSVVFYAKAYVDTDFALLVEDFANRNPDLVMEQPQVRVVVYPNSGEERIVEVSFTYQNSRADLRKMQEQVENIFTSAELYVQQTKVKETFARLYSFLTERNDYTLETSITPAYSLLHHGVGDSRAFANVYAAMCRRANLDCQVISGTKNGEPWFWNAVRYQGRYYHVDLLSGGKFQMLKDEDMTGYVWDYSAF
ncbi:MAG: hypothetical protein IKJ94_03505 [Oscillospiraceae bacterium]|nr:hypothetical protein [Oscillospiraceae bacterium]